MGSVATFHKRAVWIIGEGDQGEMSHGNRREYPLHPIVGVGAVIIEGGRLLLIKRLHEPGAGQWTIPGGKVELGENLEDAAKREILEECGIDINIQKLAGIVERVVRDDQNRIRYHYIIVDYLAQYLNGTLKAGSDVADAAWIPLGEMDAYELTPGLQEFLNTVI